MATNYGKTCENENYGGMCRIYVDLYRDMLWAVFIDKLPIPKLVCELEKILANPRTFKQFHHQFKRLLDLYASTGTIKNTDCTISIIYSLLRNIPTTLNPPTRGWGTVPQPGDVLVTDDLERIHHGRNELVGHAAEASITDADFTAQLSDIKDIVTRLDGHLGSSYLPHLLQIENDCQSNKDHLKTKMEEQEQIYSKDPWAGLIPQQTPREPLPSNQPTQNKEESFPEYSMTRKPRGICVIINNENFVEDGLKLERRKGTDVDKAGLKKIFEKLHFIVKLPHDDLTDTEMKDTLVEAQKMDHTNFDCFVCCILTHGGRGFLYGSNNKEIDITDITSKFEANNCRSLFGKPKLFFFQTCMGPNTMEGKLETDGPQQRVETDGPQQRVETDGDRKSVPNMADFLLGYPTVIGYLTKRNDTDGSWYIGTLVQMLEEHSHNQDLLSILVKVNEEVSMKGSTIKQIPAPLVTLRKKLYFR